MDFRPPCDVAAHQLGDGLRDGVHQCDVVELVALTDLFGHGALTNRRRTKNTHTDGLQTTRNTDGGVQPHENQCNRQISVC